jgi:hypothetical protein
MKASLAPFRRGQFSEVSQLVIAVPANPWTAKMVGRILSPARLPGAWHWQHVGMT